MSRLASSAVGGTDRLWARGGAAGRYECVLALSPSIYLELVGPEREENTRRCEAVQSSECHGDLREDRRPVGWVDPEGLERLNRVGIHRLSDEEAARLELVACELQEPIQRVEREVFDHLGGEHDSE